MSPKVCLRVIVSCEAVISLALALTTVFREVRTKGIVGAHPTDHVTCARPFGESTWVGLMSCDAVL